MIKSLMEIDWLDMTEYFPAIITALAMPFTFSIADGLGIGFISYIFIKNLSGKRQDCSLASYFVAGVFAIKFLFLD